MQSIIAIQSTRKIDCTDGLNLGHSSSPLLLFSHPFKMHHQWWHRDITKVNDWLINNRERICQQMSCSNCYRKGFLKGNYNYFRKQHLPTILTSSSISVSPHGHLQSTRWWWSKNIAYISSKEWQILNGVMHNMFQLIWVWEKNSHKL